MSKKLLLIPIAILLGVSLIACASPAPAPAPAPGPAPTTTVTAPAATVTAPAATVTAPAPAPAPAPTMKPQEWTFTTFETTITSPQLVEWQLAFDRVKEHTGGMLEIRISPFGELPITGAEQLRAVSSGEIEMFMMFGGYHRGDAPILSMTDIPYTWHNQLEKVKAFYETYPIVESELNKMNIHVFPTIRAHDRLALLMNEPISITDAKKLKIRSYGTAVGMVIEAMNGVATPLAWGESYTAIERGTVNGILTGLGALYRAGFYEVAPYGYDIAYLSNFIWPCINLEKWNALPADVQNILHDEIIRAGVTNIARNPVYEGEYIALMSAALESWYAGPPSQAFFEKMRANVTEPLFVEAVGNLGTVGDQMLAALEKALEREIVE